MSQAATFLMFSGQAEEAIRFYVSLFDDGEVLALARYGPAGPGPEGTVMRAEFRLAGQRFMATDSFVTHAFGFTPAISVFVTCGSDAEVDTLFARLSEGGQVMMPLGAYPFSPRFGWTSDRFGVSWQISLLFQVP